MSTPTPVTNVSAGSSASFVSERLTQSLRLPRLNHGVRIMGIAFDHGICLYSGFPSSLSGHTCQTSHLLTQTLEYQAGLTFSLELMRQGRGTGVPGSPSAFETMIGWVLAGETNICVSNLSVMSYHAFVYCRLYQSHDNVSTI